MGIKQLEVTNGNFKVAEMMEQEKVKLIILDGYKNKIIITEAVTHGETILETVKGVGKRIIWRESELI